MRTRPITALAAALALLTAAPALARAQTPTPTPTPTPTASDAKAKRPTDVQRVYDDYSEDSVIDVCSHTLATLQKTLDTIDPTFDQDYPDFRAAIEAGIERHKSGKCAGDTTSGGSTGAGAGATATPTPTATSTAHTGTSGSGAESGTLPPAAGGGGGKTDDGGGAVPPQDQIPPPASVTPVPTVAPAAPATPPAAATPVAQVVVHSGHRSLTVPLILIAIALLGAAFLALSALLARRNPRVAHAWREAAYRTRGTWADFSDWLRLGR